MKYQVTKTFEIEANSQSHADMLVSEDVALKYPERGVLKKKGWSVWNATRADAEIVRDESKDQYYDPEIKLIENK